MYLNRDAATKKMKRANEDHAGDRLSRLVTIIKRLVHHAVYIYCILSLSCLLSFLCNPYIPFQIYEIFHLLVKLTVCIHHIEVITFARFELGPIGLESLLVKETFP